MFNTFAAILLSKGLATFAPPETRNAWMSDGAIHIGEKIHLIERRQFKEDVRRHFAGTVRAVALGAIRVEGFTFIVSPVGLEVRRLLGKRTRIFGIYDSGYIINILPDEVDIENLSYEARSARLVISDGLKFSLEVNEHL